MSLHPYELPELPYDFSALEPVISAQIMELHYLKHHKGYVTNLNAALEKYSKSQSENNLEAMIAEQQAIRFNGGGHLNHSIFWTTLAPVKKGGGGEPKGELLAAIVRDFGSFAQFVEKMGSKTAAIQGSGWGWLGYCKEKKGLVLTTCANQDPLSTQGLAPLFGIDVWEHAYYLQYKNVRADYVKKIWEIANWGEVEKRFLKARA